MRILISSHRFPPSIGGTEQVSATLAEEFAVLGHEVRVITATATPDGRVTPYAVSRCPSRRSVLESVRWCEIYFQNNVSLATLWPAPLLHRPTVVTTQTWVTRVDGSVGWREVFKRACLRRVSQNIAISDAIAASLPCPAVVIPNPYRDDVFFVEPDVPRDRELIFVGRLVSDKGCDLLLDALGHLAAQGIAPRLTIVGGGPDEAALRRKAVEARVDAQVSFTGPLAGAALRRELNRHEFLVVPSRWAEPFGIVALEGIACGCGVIGSKGGGLPAAIGPCGAVFSRGDPSALVASLADVLRDRSRRLRWQQDAPAHLSWHGRRKIAERYLRIFGSLVAR